MQKKKLLAMILSAAFMWTVADVAALAAELTPKVAAAEELTVEGTENAGQPEVAIEVAGEVEATGLTAHTVTAKAGCSAADLQALLDLNINGEYNLTVVIPAGTYKMTKTLYIYPNTTIKAAADAKLIKQSRYGAMLETALVNDDGGYDGNKNITIDGGNWDSKPLKFLADCGTETFRFIHTSNIVIQNAKLGNVPEGSHLIVFAGVQNATVTNCKFYGYGDDGKDELTPKEAVQLDTAHSTSQVPTHQDVAWDDLPCDNITIEKCEFTDFSRGIGSHTAVAGRIHSNITIKDNTFTDMADSAIRLYNYKDTIVSNNTVNGAEAGILAYTCIENADENAYFEPLNGKVGTLPSNYNITISSNTIKNIKDKDKVWGDGIRVIGTKGRWLSGVTISGNTIQTTSRYGIFASGAPKLTIGNKNKITGTTSDGILISEECDNSTVYKNTISKAKNAGISVYHSDSVSVYGNTVSATEDAIYLLDSQHCVIGESGKNGNTVTSSKGNGISLSTMGKKKATGCTSSKVQYNTVRSAKLNGIFIYKTKKAIISENTVNSADQCGIMVSTSSTNASVTNNTIKTSKENGIAVTSGSKNAQVTGNKITKYATAGRKSKCYGIIIFESGGSKGSNTRVLDNTITGSAKKSGRNGVQISSSSYTTVSGNTITKPDGMGIYAYKSKNCTIGSSAKNYNIITSPKEGGIYVTQDCDSNKISYNKVTGAKKDGIGVYASKKAVINKNTVSASENGISLSTKCSQGKVTDNVINSAGGNGISVTSQSKQVTISGNTVKKYSTAKAEASGIYVYQSAGASSKKCNKIADNTITGKGNSTKKNAIKVSEAAYTAIESNTIKSPAGAGVYLYKSGNCSINKNNITSAKSSGIKVTTSCDSTKVISNTVKKTGDTAISLYQAPKSEVSSNKVTTTKKYRGIWVSTSNNATIKSNTVKGAAKSEAILVTGSTGCKESKNKTK